uniref:DNA-directed RNA polymerase subunit n=1 Tax=Parascaris univalens TaxID=6257 RepID=A0A915C547_PARUN
MFAADEEFCSTCGTILPLPDTAPTTVTCALCHTKWHIKPIINKLVYRTEKIYERRLAETKEADVENPIVEKICEKCGHDKMSYACRQTRSADEGQTVFYTCLNCKYSIVENA